MTNTRPVLVNAETIVAKYATQRQRVVIRLAQLNDEIIYLLSEIAAAGTEATDSMKETLAHRYEEKATASKELDTIDASLNGELGSLKEDLITERLNVLKAGRDEQNALANEIMRAKVTYLKNLVNLSDLAKSIFGDVSSYNEIGKMLNIDPIKFVDVERYPYPVPASNTGFSPYVAPNEIQSSYEGNLIYNARSYEQNYMKSPYKR